MGRAIFITVFNDIQSMSLEYLCRTLSKPQLLQKSISEVTVVTEKKLL